MIRNKLIKTLILCLVILPLTCSFLLSNNKVLCAIEPSSLDGDIALVINNFRKDTTKYSLNVNYSIKYDIKSSATAKTETIKLWRPSYDGHNFNTTYTVNELKYEFIQNDAVSKNIMAHVGEDTDGLLVYNGTNGNGTELIIKASNYTITEVKVFYLNTKRFTVSSDYGDATIIGTTESAITYGFDSTKETNEISIKNTSDSYVKVREIVVTYKDYSLVNVTGNILKNNGKNICSMQAIGRITKEQYDVLKAYAPNNNMYFGLLYCKNLEYETHDSQYELSSIIMDKEHSTCSFIQEISIDELQGYDETGYVKSTNPTYYQWGVSINNISDKYLNTKITAVAYIRLNYNNQEFIFTTIDKKESVKSLAETYINYSTLNKYDKAFLSLLASD